MDDSAEVRAARAESCLVVLIDRPRVRNALGERTVAQLEDALDRAERDPEVRAVVLSGGPSWFCSGVDLREVAANDPAADPVAATARLRHVHRLVERLRSFPKPTVAAVEGYAIGIGFALVLATDLVVASRSAFFAHPPTAAGMLADGGLVRDLNRLIGYRRTIELLLRRQRLPAEKAMEYGLVNQLSEPGRTLSDAEAVVREFATLPVEVLFGVKALAVAASTSADSSFLAHEGSAVAMLKLTPANVEGRRRFLDGHRFLGTV